MTGEPSKDEAEPSPVSEASKPPAKRKITDFFRSQSGEALEAPVSGQPQAKKLKSTRSTIPKINKKKPSKFYEPYYDGSLMPGEPLAFRNDEATKHASLAWNSGNDAAIRIGRLILKGKRDYKLDEDAASLKVVLESRGLLINGRDKTVRAVDAKRDPSLSGIRTLRDAENKFGSDNIWLFDNAASSFVTAESYNQTHKYQSAQELFAKIRGTVFEKPGTGLPDAIYQLPDGNYGSRSRFDRDWAEVGTHPDLEASVLIRSPSGTGYQKPSTLEWRATDQGDPEYFNNKIESLGLNLRKIQRTKRVDTPDVIVRHNIDEELFVSGENISARCDGDTHYELDKSKIFIANRNKNSRGLTGNLTVIDSFLQWGHVATDRQEELLRKIKVDFVHSDRSIAAEQSAATPAAENSPNSATSSQSQARRDLAARSRLHDGRSIL